ncbi:MAG: tetratricopeptide repeat protein [Deltaproteobacteria bacterium]|nr:tetratricopeptide repeat protein [Deltaproteobacteria bacterium]
MSSPGNEGLVEDRLRELVSLKGRDDPYVLQITAYWRMKLGDLERASSLLGRLLQRDPENLVAGLNMAVLEFRSGRRSNALRRLKKIRNLYPEDERVAELLARMKP